MGRRSTGHTPKWTIKQDKKLRQAVQKHGKTWTFISQKYKFQRSINSLVKRWHGKLKDQTTQRKNQNYKFQISQDEQYQNQIQFKTKRIKKQTKKQYVNQQNFDYESEEIQNSQQIVSQDDILSQHNQTLSNQIQLYAFQHQWRQEEDRILKDLVVNQKIMNWEQISKRLKITNEKQVRRRWQKNIYQSIIQTKKIGGCVKYSDEEDAILSRGVKMGLTIQELRKFLPSRTLYSLDARRRRTLKADEEQHTDLRYWKKRSLAFRFLQKRHEHLQKPVSEQQFLYRSESE